MFKVLIFTLLFILNIFLKSDLFFKTPQKTSTELDINQIV